jgi:hypothetical protein
MVAERHVGSNLAAWRRARTGSVCGARRSPAIGTVDVPSGSIVGFSSKPTLHIHYGEEVLAVRDGLPKFKDFPKDFGGSGDTLAEQAAR